MESTRPPSAKKRKPARPSPGQAAPSGSRVDPAHAGSPLGLGDRPLAPPGDNIELPTRELERPASKPEGSEVVGFRSPELSPASSAAGDPFGSASNIVWYVRPPSGGQYGPATSEVLQVWLDENRISPDTLVWREGWRDWQEAAAVFPQLASNGGGAGPEETGRFAARKPPSGTAGSRFPAQRRSASRSALVWITILGLAVLVLGIVLVWVVFRG